MKGNLYSAKGNSCEAITVHNAKVLKGKESTLSETMLEIQSNHAMFGYGRLMCTGEKDGQYSIQAVIIVTPILAGA